MITKPVSRHIVANNAMRISERLLEHYAIKEIPTVQDMQDVLQLVYAVLIAKRRWVGELDDNERRMLGLCSRYYELTPGVVKRESYRFFCESGGIRAGQLAHSYYDAACPIHPTFAADLMDID